MSGSSADSDTRMSAAQHEMVELFMHFGHNLGLPKSVGAIYGLLYATAEPLSLDAIVTILQISKGSASQGLRFLQNLNAVQVVYLPGQRRDHFTAERRLRKLANGFLRERVEPHLEHGADRLDRIGDAIDPDDPNAVHLKKNLERLRNWYRKSRQILPLVRNVIG
ncbi:MAG: transcriptional regulator protein-like protein [Puniceicoccaceae bacterium 5H]|nr:MAG: transcriptional regulator protein-like protein [Puniceicoccaceae bacterium 5H]